MKVGIPRSPIPWKRFPILLALITSLLWMGPGPSGGMEDPERQDKCASFYHDLEQVIDGSDARNGGVYTIPRYPFLRTTRFLEGIKYFVTDREERDQWFDLLIKQGHIAAAKEIENLPDSAVEKLVSSMIPEESENPMGPENHRNRLKERSRKCAENLLAQINNQDTFNRLLYMSNSTPDDYHTGRKALGLYPLFTIPIGAAITNYKNREKKRYAKPLASLHPRGTLTLFSPDSNSFPGFPETDPHRLLTTAADNPLQIPLLKEKELEWIIFRYAPHLEQDVTENYDLPGRVEWQGDHIRINTTKPTVYYYATHMIHRGQPLLQLNYVFWYTERPRITLIDIETGRIHGMTFRLTLDQAGEPMMADVIHNCGCYHFFFPSKEFFKEPRNERFRENAFVPQWLPDFQPDARLTVRIGTKRHLVERLHYDRGRSPDALAYTLMPYDLLESLPRDSGEKESIFTPRGIAKGCTERPERFLLFSVGIPKIGSMRQRGHHGTSLIGERIFDDPRLFEKYFTLK